jgi:hypothetical protein
MNHVDFEMIESLMSFVRGRGCREVPAGPPVTARPPVRPVTQQIPLTLLNRSLAIATVLFTTGYTANAVVQGGELNRGVQFIGKPFTLDQLGAKISSVPDA